MSKFITILVVLFNITTISLAQTTTAEPETTVAGGTTSVETTSSGTESMTTESGTDMMTTDMISTTSVMTTASTIITGPDCECMPGKTNCAGKSIILMLIKKLMCGSINSCLNSKFKILEIWQDPVEMDCSENSFNWGQIVAKNMKSVKCSKGGCKGSKFELIGNINDGCNMDCDGDESCKNTNVTIENPKEIKCKGMTSCMGSQFNISKPIDNKVHIECNENYACKDTIWVIYIESNTELEFLIEGLDTARDSTIEIKNKDSSTIMLDAKFECKKPNACKNLKILIDVSITIISTETLQCESQACIDVTMNGAPAAFKLIDSTTNNESPTFFTKTNIIILTCVIIITLLISLFIILFVLKNKQKNKKINQIKADGDTVKEDSSSNNNDIIKNNNELLDTGINGQTTTV